MVRAVPTKDLLILSRPGHAHLRILRRNVWRSGLVPAVGAGIHVALLKCALALCLSRQSLYILR